MDRVEARATMGHSEYGKPLDIIAKNRNNEWGGMGFIWSGR